MERDQSPEHPGAHPQEGELRPSPQLLSDQGPERLGLLTEQAHQCTGETDKLQTHLQWPEQAGVGEKRRLKLPPPNGLSCLCLSHELPRQGP